MHSTVVRNDQATRLRELVRQSRQRAETRHLQMFAVASGKGGVGKSTISLNAAIAMAEEGRRVLLVDADHNLGNLATMLGVTPKYTFVDVLKGECDVTEALMHVNDRLDFLATSSGDTQHPPVTEKETHHLATLLRSLDIPKDVVLIDLSAGIAPPILSLCLAADEMLVVTTDEPTAVMDAYALIKMITLTNALHPVSLVVNNVVTQQAADETYKKLSLVVNKFLHRSLRYYGGIPSDREVQRAVYAQKPLLHLAPYSAAALSIRASSQRLVHHQSWNRKEYIQ